MRPCVVSALKIEKMKRTVKTHRAAVDFDKSFCKAKVVVFLDIFQMIHVTAAVSTIFRSKVRPTSPKLLISMLACPGERLST